MKASPTGIGRASPGGIFSILSKVSLFGAGNAHLHRDLRSVIHDEGRSGSDAAEDYVVRGSSPIPKSIGNSSQQQCHLLVRRLRER